MEKEKKMIIILSITSGVLLLLLLISSGYNYKQYNDNNTCTTTSKNLNSTSQNLQNKQQAQLKELINLMSSKNTDMKAVGMPTPDQIDCLLKQVYQKYTPFDILYNIISFFFASASEMVVENKGTTPWASSVVSTLVDMRNVGCASVQTCNIASSPDLVNACKQKLN